MDADPQRRRRSSSREPRVRDALVAVACASRSLDDALVHDPTLVDVLATTSTRPMPTVDARGPGRAPPLEAARAAAHRRRRPPRADRPPDRRAAPRGPRRRLPRPGPRARGRRRSPFAIIGMGKLGGRELNYASDVDVLFVHDGDSRRRRARSPGRAVDHVGAHRGRAGVPHRRRPASGGPRRRAVSHRSTGTPPGTSGGPSPWEFQALIKARPVAGDPDVGRASSSALTRPFVWPEVLDPDAVREVRAMKARAEAEVQRRGLDDRELKRGRGRDPRRRVRGAAAAARPRPRRPDACAPRTTLDALGAARRRRLRRSRRRRPAPRRLHVPAHGRAPPAAPRRAADPHPARRRREPDAAGPGARLPRRADRRAALDAVRSRPAAPAEPSCAASTSGCSSPRSSTRSPATGPLSPEAAEERLAAFGFVDADHTRRRAARAHAGPDPHLPHVCSSCCRSILDWLSSAPDPDLGLLQLRRLAEGPHPGAARSPRRSATNPAPPSGPAGCSARAGSSATRCSASPRSWSSSATTTGSSAERSTRRAASSRARRRLGWRQDTAGPPAGLRRFKRRELLRIAARDVARPRAARGDVPRARRARRRVRRSRARRRCARPLPFAVIGMGRLGGRELSYSSDIDVLFVYDGDEPARLRGGHRDWPRPWWPRSAPPTAEGQTFRVDANLRPEGKPGPARPLPRRIPRLLRAVGADLGAPGAAAGPARRRRPRPRPPLRRDGRAVRVPGPVPRRRRPRGAADQGPRRAGADPARRGSPVPPQARPGRADRHRVHGAAAPAPARRRRTRRSGSPATVPALRALGAAGLLPADDAEVLVEAYTFCERARNACYLVTGRPTDSLPTGPRRGPGQPAPRR